MADRARYARAAESSEQRETRLARRRVADRARYARAAESSEQRETRLARRRVADRARFAARIAEQREARLQQRSATAQHRLASETPEQREALLHQLRVTAQQRLASEIPEDREARLQQDRETHMQRRHPATSEFPLLQQPGVHSEMKTFLLASLTVSKCITCLERFPGLTVAIVSPDSTECVRCRRDKHIPKVYSTTNNMNPGPDTRLKTGGFQRSTRRRIRVRVTNAVTHNCTHVRINIEK